MSRATSLINPVHVAVGVIFDPVGNVLISRRPLDKHQGGLWEFPGGKVDAGERVDDALRRELSEELGIAVLEASAWRVFPFNYPDKSVLLDVWYVTAIAGEPRGLEGQPVRWAPLASLESTDFPAANRFILNALRLPDQYLVTPSPSQDLDTWLHHLDVAMAAGLRLIQVRSESRPDPATAQRLFPAVASLAARHGATVLASHRLAERTPMGWHGMHWPSRLLDNCVDRPDGLLAVSCHTESDLARAQDIGADFAVLGPVCRTLSHPDSRPLGWSAFSAAVRETALPVYAIGGQGGQTQAQAIQAGGQGIAAIRGLWPGAV